jgi:polar amino acid transport system substrate-binding protein
VIIGVDPHKGSHAATPLSPTTNASASSLRVDATLAGHRQLLRWGKAFPERQWAAENARGLGRHLVRNGSSLAVRPWSTSAPLRPHSTSERGDPAPCQRVVARVLSSGLTNLQGMPSLGKGPWGGQDVGGLNRHGTNLCIADICARTRSSPSGGPQVKQQHRFFALYSMGIIVIGIALILIVAACGSTSTSASSSPSASSAASGPASLLPAAIRQSGVLTVGSNFQEPPWGSYTSGTTTPVGLDVDVMTAVTHLLGLNVKWTAMQWAGLRPALQTHRFDAVIADMYDYTDRQAQVTFVDYVNDGDAVAVVKANAGKITSVDSLAGQKVGVAIGTSAAIEAQKLNSQFKSKGLQPMVISTFADDPTGFLALRAGRTFAYIGENATVSYECQNSGGGTLFSEVLPGIISGTMCGIVVNRDSTGTALANSFKAALDQLIQNGTYGQILAKYGMSAGALKIATINGSKVSSKTIG